MASRTFGGRSLLVLVAVGVMGAIAWVTLGPRRTATPQGAHSTDPGVDLPDPASAAVASPVTDSSLRDAPPVREEVRDDLILPPVLLEGRCIAAESGLPLMGCRVDLRDGARTHSTLTGPDGRFELRLVLVEPVPPLVLLDIRGERRAPRREVFETDANPEATSADAPTWTLVPGERRSLGDVALALGGLVQGRVVDTSGTTIAGVQVEVRDLCVSLDPEQPCSQSATSQRGGTFQLSDLIPLGTWPLSARYAGFDLVQPDHVVVESTDVPAELLLVMAGVERSISGRVVTEAGESVEGMEVRTTTGGFDERASTNRRGEFKIHGSKSAPELVQLHCYDDEERYESLMDERRFYWGTHDIALVVRPALSVQVCVTDSQSDAPIEDFAVVCYPENTWYQDVTLRCYGPHPEGRAIVSGVHRGQNVLRVVPEEEEYEISEDIQFTGSDLGSDPLKVALVRLAPVRILVVLDSGEPVAGTWVELVRPAGAIGLRDEVLDPVDHGSSESGHRRISGAETDPLGFVQLHAPRNDPVTIRVLGPGHVPLLIPARVIDSDFLRIELQGGATVSGRVIHVPEGTLLAWLEFLPGGDTDEGWIARLEGESTYRLRGLAPASYEVRLGLALMTGEPVSLLHAPRLAPPIGTVDLREGGSHTLDLDASVFALARVRGEVVLDSVSMRVREVVLRRCEDGESWSLATLTPDAMGRFEARGILPGSYRVVVGLEDFSGTSCGYLLGSESVEVPAGGDVSTRVSLGRTMRLGIEILQADGQPLRSAPCWVVSEHWSHAVRTDASGWLVLDPAPNVPFQIATEESISELVEVPHGPDGANVTVTLGDR